MTVAEAIALLATMPQDAEFAIADGNSSSEIIDIRWHGEGDVPRCYALAAPATPAIADRLTEWFGAL